MAGTSKAMSQIKQLIILNRQGQGVKSIARTLAMSKNTVKTYLFKLEKLVGDPENGLGVDQLLGMEEPEIYHLFHPGNPAYKDSRYEDFKSHLGYFVSELRRKGVTRNLLWTEYRQSRPDGYGYSQFCFHLDQHSAAAPKPSLVLQHTPAEKLFIDFAGKTIAYIDRETGEEIQCQLFVGCLPFSDYAFAMAVSSQRLQDFLFALARCMEFLGGATAALVPDNFKAAIDKADRYEPTVNRAMEEFANHYGMAVVPARAGKPKDKARVENQVKILYSRVYARLRNMQFFDLDSLNEAILTMIRAHNQTRMKQKEYSREEQFLASEKPLLKPLPAESFELRYQTMLLVAKNNHVYLGRDNHYYSVPYTLIGKKVKVIYTRSMVYIYDQGKKVAVHRRGSKAGGYSTFGEHLCSQHQHYLDRSPDYYRNMAFKKSQVLGEFVTALFEQKKYPEQLYRTCDGLFSLSRKNDPEKLDKACRLAMENGVYSYVFIKKVVENKAAFQQTDQPEKQLPNHGNLRGKEYYQQQEIKY